MNFKIQRIFLWGMLYILINTSIFANLMDAFGPSASGIGMAGAKTAIVNDWTSPFYNIAGLTYPVYEKKYQVIKLKKTAIQENFLDENPDQNLENNKIRLTNRYKTVKASDIHHQIGISYMYQYPMMYVNTNSQSKKVNYNMQSSVSGMNYGAIYTGLVFDVRSIFKTPFNTPVRFGLTLGIRDNGTIMTLQDTSVKSYNFQKIGDEAQRIVILAGLSFQAWKKRLSIGFGVSALAGGSGDIRMNEVIIDPTGATQQPPQEVLMTITPVIAPTTGITYRQPIKYHNLFIALSYRSEIYMELDPLNAKATTKLMSIELPMQLSVLDYYTPHIITFGVAFELKKSSYKFIFTIDTEYQLWSKFKVSSARALNETFTSFNDVFIGRFGADTPIPLHRIKKIKFLRSVRYLRGRVGYAFHQAFTADQTKESNFLDNVKHVFSFGFSYLIKRSKYVKATTTLDLGFQYQYWAERESVKETSDELNPSYSYGGNLLMTSFSSSLKF